MSVSLERQLKPEKVNGFRAIFYGSDWRRYRKYVSPERAIQAYEHLVKSGRNRDFDWRIHTKVGYIRLPVVSS